MTEIDNQVLTKKQKEEQDLTQRFLRDKGLEHVNLSSRPEPEPDIQATIEDRNIGIEVTGFHVDEGTEGQFQNSSLRQAGEIKARNNPGQSYVMSVPTDPHPALAARVKDKIDKQYNLTGIDEFWLLVSAQQPSLGALPATFVAAFSIDIRKLNSDLHENLNSSHFSRVYWHLIHEHAIYGWNREHQWHIVRRANPPDTSGLEALNMIRR